MIIDLTQLRTFVAVAEEQHLTRAAERLHISQSAASAHVRAVEDGLDMQLFARTNRGLELTSAGQLLLQQAKGLLNRAAEFTSFAREMKGEAAGDLIVGTSSEPAASRLGEVVMALRSRHPLIKVDVRAQPSAGTRQALKSGEIDVGMLLAKPTDSELAYYQLASIPFRITGPAAWKEKISNADWSELAAMPWITPTNSSLAYGKMLSQLFADKGLELNTVVRFDNGALGRSLVHAGVGLLLMREDYALQGERDNVLALSPIARPEYPFFLAHLHSRGNDPLIRAFVDAAAAVWPGMGSTPAEKPQLGKS